MKKKPNTKPLKKLSQHLQDPKNWFPPAEKKTKKQGQKNKSTTPLVEMEKITFQQLANHLQKEKSSHTEVPPLPCSLLTFGAATLIIAILGDTGVFCIPPAYIAITYFAAAALLFMGIISGTIATCSLTDNKSNHGKIKNIKATQTNIKSFFSERELKAKNYKDQPVLQTIRDNPIEVIV